MQSASMKEANANGAHKLAEETTLIQLMFGGYLRSKVFYFSSQIVLNLSNSIFSEC